MNTEEYKEYRVTLNGSPWMTPDIEPPHGVLLIMADLDVSPPKYCFGTYVMEPVGFGFVAIWKVLVDDEWIEEDPPHYWMEIPRLPNL